MRKTIFFILSSCLALVASAEPIGKQAALYTAQTYMLEKGKSINTVQKPFRAARQQSDQAEEIDAYYYIFNAGNDGGYVIVSGDDRTEPILGYVDHGSFDPENIPENLRSWLQSYADQIKYIVDNDLKPESPELKKRNRVRTTKRSVPELLTTRWNQGHPYNLTCPMYYKEDGSQDYPASGCTATAMAQVMNFYKHPEKTVAIIPAHSNTYTLSNGTKKTSTAKAVPRNTPIDWEYMNDIYNCNDSHEHDRADTAVANLLLYCGQTVKMGWGPSSGANFSAEAFIKYFGYDNSCYVGERRDYSIDDWFDMLYNEIEQGYPVLFSGFSSGGGHAFVLDGFDGDNLFHLNWGWGGGSNGWFLVSILNPGDNSGIGASSSSDGYSMSQRALFNLRLPDDNNADTYLFIKDVSTTDASIKATFENRTGASGSFNTAIVKLDDDGGLSVVGTMQTITGMSNSASQTKTFIIKDKLPEGTYRLSPASKATKSEEWRAKYNLRNHYIEAVVDDEGNTTLTPIDINNEENISIDTIVFPGTRIAGQEQEVRVTYRNNGNEYFKEVLFFASKTQNKIYTESRSMVTVRKGETVDVSYFFTPDETGTYNLWFCTNSNGTGEVGQGTVEIIEASQAVKANLSVSSYTITNAVSGTVYGKRLVGKAAIKNNAKTEFDGKIRIQIWRQYNAAGSAWSGSSKTYSVNIAAGKIANVDFDFEDLAEGDKYYLATSYVNQDGSLTNGGVWELGGWMMDSGILTWKTNGVIAGMARRPSLSAGTTLCGIYADCDNITRLTPNNNPNTIYAFASGMTVPESARGSNIVEGAYANHINLVNDQPFYLPVSFEADSASFTYTFPETENGKGWHAFTMPFDVDEISVDDIPVTLDNSLNHFWIYEFAAQGDDGEIIFQPATILRGNTPYIIAADSTMAGRSVVFRSVGVPFYKTGADKMVVSTDEYQFHGITYAPALTNCYILNSEGTAFEYKATSTTISALSSYFTTKLSEELRLESIVLPDVPKAMDDGATVTISAAGYATFVAPFDVDFTGAEVTANAATFGGTYIQLTPVATVPAGTAVVVKGEEGTYSIPATAHASLDVANELLVSDGIEADGTQYILADEEEGVGFYKATGSIPAGKGYLVIETFVKDFYGFEPDDATGIRDIDVAGENAPVYNLAGQRLDKAQKGVNIIAGKKILK